MDDKRHFQIQDYDSYFYVEVDSSTSEEEIFNLACDKANEVKKKEVDNYYPSFFRQPPRYKPTMKVVEMAYKIEKLPHRVNGETILKDTKNWFTKPNGLKFTLENSRVTIKYTNGTVYEGNGYRFGHKIVKEEKPKTVSFRNFKDYKQISDKHEKARKTAWDQYWNGREERELYEKLKLQSNRDYSYRQRNEELLPMFLEKMNGGYFCINSKIWLHIYKKEEDYFVTFIITEYNYFDVNYKNETLYFGHSEGYHKGLSVYNITKSERDFLWIPEMTYYEMDEAEFKQKMLEYLDVN